MKQDDFESTFDLKKFGSKRQLWQRMQDIIEEHKKQMERKDNESKKLSEEEKKDLAILAQRTNEGTAIDDDQEDSMPIDISQSLSVKMSLIRAQSSGWKLRATPELLPIKDNKTNKLILNSKKLQNKSKYNHFIL